MVNQQIKDQSQQSLSQDSGGLDDFRIVDETTPEQLEIEAELDNESGQTAETQQTVDVEGFQHSCNSIWRACADGIA